MKQQEIIIAIIGLVAISVVIWTQFKIKVIWSTNRFLIPAKYLSMRFEFSRYIRAYKAIGHSSFMCLFRNAWAWGIIRYSAHTNRYKSGTYRIIIVKRVAPKKQVKRKR